MTYNACRGQHHGERVYLFKCSTCGAEGPLGLRIDQDGPFVCPEDCGTIYVEHPTPHGWVLRAVVLPHSQNKP